MSCSACSKRSTMRIIPAPATANKQPAKQPAGGSGFTNRGTVPSGSARKPVRGR